MTTEWQAIDLADADLALLGITKLTDVSTNTNSLNHPDLYDSKTYVACKVKATIK